MTELRECECGRLPQILTRRPFRDGVFRVASAWVECTPCGARGSGYATEADAISAWNRRADDWQPIETAPRDRPVEVYAPQPDRLQWGDALSDLPEIMCIAKWHTDAGFCVCTIREVTHWREVRRPLPKGPGG